jgi:hypothetical protein
MKKKLILHLRAMWPPLLCLLALIALLFLTSCEVTENSNHAGLALLIMAVCFYLVYKLGQYVRKHSGMIKPDYPPDVF